MTVSTELLAFLVLGPTAVVLVAVFMVMWLERKTSRESWIAVAAGIVLAGWAVAAAILAARGSFRPPDDESAPPVGIAIAVSLLSLSVCLASSPSLRGLLTRQENLILLNLWRLVGLVFLILMWTGQMPGLWALPAGIGDVIVGGAAPWIARQLGAPNGGRRAILFNLFGMADLIVAVGLGVMTSPGPLRVFHTTPTAELATEFPLALVPTFLVPLAFMLHVVSLWQLFGWKWKG